MNIKNFILILLPVIVIVSCATEVPRIEYRVKVPVEFQKIPSNPPPNGESEAIRYRESFEAFWWNCVIIKADNLDGVCPSACSGTSAAVAGCKDGASDAENKITDLLSTYFEPEVMLYLRSIASSEEAKMKINPYFQKAPQPPKVQ